MPRASMMQMMRGAVSMRDVRSTPSHHGGAALDDDRQPDVPGGADNHVNGDSKPSTRSPLRRKQQRRRQTVDSSNPSVRAGMDDVAAAAAMEDAASPGRRRGQQGQDPSPNLVNVFSDLVTIPSYNPQNQQQQHQRPTKATYDLIQNKRWDVIPSACTDRPSDARYTDAKNHLPIHWACYYGAPYDVVSALHEAHGGGVESINLKGDLPLHRACRGRASADVVRFVRDANPDATSVENHYGETPVDLLDVSGRSYREREAVREVFYPRPAMAAAAATVATTRRFGSGVVGGPTQVAMPNSATLRHTTPVQVPPAPAVVPGSRSGSAVASSGTNAPGGGAAATSSMGFGHVVGDAPPTQPAAMPRQSAARAAPVTGGKNPPGPATIPEGPSYSSSLGEDDDVSNEVVSDDNRGPSPSGPGGLSSADQPQLRRRRSSGATSSSVERKEALADGGSARASTHPAAAPPVARSASATAAETDAAAREAARAGWMARRDDMGPLGGGGPPPATRSASSSSASAALEARAAVAQAEVAAREAERAAHAARRASAKLDEAAAEARRAREEADEARRRAAEMRRAADEAEGRMLVEARRAAAAAAAAEERGWTSGQAGAVEGATAAVPGAMPGHHEDGGGFKASGNEGLVRPVGFSGGEEGGLGSHPLEDGGGAGAIPLPPEPV